MTPELTPAQTKAARALLAWSQADLAKAANLGASTVADFERRERTPHNQNVEAMRAAFEARGIAFLAGGAVEATGLAAAGLMAAVGKGVAAGGAPAPWITSADLIEWAGRRDGQEELPLLINHLIRAEKGALAHLHIPAGDSVTREGWDGICRVDQGSEYIPAGVSGWEVSAQRTKLKEKADRGYETRTKDPLTLTPSETTYVHVTLQPWPSGEAWAGERRAEGIWKDVRVIDADALVHWIQMHAAVSHWLAVRIGKRPHGLTQLDEAFAEWSIATKIPLTGDIVLVDREDEAASVHKWLSGPPAVMSVQAEAVDEAMAFLHAAIARLPAPERQAVLARAIIAETEQTARALFDTLTPLLIVLPAGEAGLAKRLASKHYVFVALGSDAGAPADVMRLPRPWGSHLHEALEPLIFATLKQGTKTQRRREAREEAQRYAKDAGRSLAILRRVMEPAPDRRPAWAKGVPSRALLGAMMAGSWDEDIEGDRAILAQLSGMAYEDVARALAHHVRDLDGAIRKAGSVWKLASVRDAWMLLSAHVTDADIELFEKAFAAVLSASDPRFGLSGEERFMAPVRGIARAHSGYLRHGLEEFAIVLAIFGDRGAALREPIARVDRLVASLFAGADAERWWSLSSDFRTLAEASPEAFLDALEAALDEDPSPLAALFTEDGDGVFDREYLSSLLWACEMLAWSDAHFPRVASLLVRLAAIDTHGGRYQNRPRNSLKSLFSLWSPQTNLSFDQRLIVLKSLRAISEPVYWQLLLAIAPRSHDISMPTPRPNWRDFETGEIEPITTALLARSGRAIADRLLADVGADPERWGAIIDLVRFNDRDWSKAAAAQLETVLMQSNDPTIRAALRGKLRDFLSQHRQFAHARWALAEIDLAPWSALYEALEPDDLAERHAWLFSYKARVERPPGKDYKAMEAELEKRRDEAAGEILDKTGTTGVFAVARAAETPAFLGFALMRSRGDDARIDALLAEARTSDEAKAWGLAQGLVMKGQELKGHAWCIALLKRARDLNWGAEAEKRILLAMRFERATWNLAAAAGEAIERTYWRDVFCGIAPPQECTFVVEKLLGAGRVADALGAVGLHLGKDNFDIPILRRVLQALAKDESGEGDPTMSAYHVGRILTRLEELGVEAREIVRFEWTFYKLLEYSERPPRMLRKAMAEDPDLFVDLARKVYVPDADSGKDEDADEKDVDDGFVQQAFEVLLDWDWIPGADAAGNVDFAKLRAWVTRARELAVASGHLKAVDGRLGSVLAFAKRDADDVWPLKAVREAIETFGNEAVERGFLTSAYNRRGVTSRGMLEGGGQERALAEDYRKWARACAMDWPKTSALLQKLAKDYETEARLHDDRADRNDWS